MTEKHERMDLYYQQRGILPTYARFSTDEDLERHRIYRANFFENKLHLPPSLFRGETLAEFGPDSGENSLVFALWGSDLTLVEPNPKSRVTIEKYFDRFNLRPRLKALEGVDISKFPSNRKYRFLDAEGFIYTVRPEEIWMRLFGEILEPGGFAIISYYDLYGGFLELFNKVIHRAARDVWGGDSKDAAWKIFETKWESIPHIRSFESWVMDVLDNPFVRLQYFFSAADLCEKASHHSLSLYSSWPNYSDAMAVYWHKIEPTVEARLRGMKQFIDRSCFSFLFGRRAFLCTERAETVSKINDTTAVFLAALDRLIDGPNPAGIRKCLDSLAEVRRFFETEPMLWDSPEERSNARQILENAARVLDAIAAGDIARLVELCRTDDVFIRSWGMPNHFAVFMKERRNE